MAVEILAEGTGVANSSTVTVTTAAKVTISLLHATGIVPYFPGELLVQIQSPAGWMFFDKLDSTKPNLLLESPGVYRVRRLPIAESIGAFRSDP